jgi:RINT-1/TIP-1 family
LLSLEQAALKETNHLFAWTSKKCFRVAVASPPANIFPKASVHSTNDLEKYCGIANTCFLVRQRIVELLSTDPSFAALQAYVGEEALLQHEFEALRRCKDRVCESLSLYVANEALKLGARYGKQRVWDRLVGPNERATLSPELVDAVEFLRDMLDLFERSCVPAVFSGLWVGVADRFDTLLFEQVESNHRFSEGARGGECGFCRDVDNLARVFLRVTPAPRDFLWRLSDLSALVSSDPERVDFGNLEEAGVHHMEQSAVRAVMEKCFL